MISTKEYKVKTKRIEALLKALTMDGNLSDAETIELGSISDEVAAYEEAHYPMEPETLKEMIELRMYQRKLKQKDLADILGTTPSRISELLNGKRDLTFDLAKAIHQKLNIDAELILAS